MTLNFPNESRSFDATRNRIRFWGYDSAVEILFFVEAEALLKLVPGKSAAGAGDVEDGLLTAFDATRDRIHQVAGKVYARGRKDTNAYTYILAAQDF
jgi:hypothetical protein